MAKKLKKPSKNKLKREYGIRNNRFKVEVRTQDPKETLAERVANIGGFRTWLLRSPIGLVVAVFLVIAEADTIFHDAPRAVQDTAATAEYFGGALKAAHNGPRPIYDFSDFNRYAATSNTVVTAVTVASRSSPGDIRHRKAWPA
jgi:hypothetical protein